MEPFLSPAAGFHLEGAAAAGDEATAAFSSVPLNACGKLKKALQLCTTSASRHEIQGKSAHPEQPNTEYSDTKTSAAAILGRRGRAGEKHQQQLPTSVPRVDAALARHPEDSSPGTI